MTPSKKDLILLMGRALIAFIFLFSTYSKITNMPDTLAYMQTAGLNAGAWLGWVAAFIELAGGLMLMLGFHAEIAAPALALYLVVVSGFFHLELGEGMQTFHLLKNMAIIGGLLNVMVSDSGKYVMKRSHG